MTIEPARQPREVAPERTEAGDEMRFVERCDIAEAIQAKTLEQRHHVAIRRNIVGTRHPRPDRADYFDAVDKCSYWCSGEPTRRLVGWHDDWFARAQRMVRCDAGGKPTVSDADTE
jgi:hypothetical protein